MKLYPIVPSKASRKLQILIFVYFIFILFLVLGYIISKAGLRGSDQYWYVADTESLLNGNGIQTNNILPNIILNDSIVQNRGFIHNVPQVYIAVLPSLIFGAFNGWLIMNTMLSVLTAVLLFFILKKKIPIDISSLISLQFLVLPLTFWQSYQPLAESFQCFLLTSILYVYYCNKKTARYYPLLLLTVLLLLCRNNYILVAPIISILFYCEIKNKYKIIYSFLYLSSILILYIILKYFLPDIWNFSFYNTIITSKVGELNSSSFIELLKIYGKNLISFFYTQFVTINSLAVFYVPFNFFVLGTVVIWLKIKKTKFNSSIFLVTFSMIFLLLTTIFSQNQARYMLPFYPIVIFGFFLQAKDSFKTSFPSSLISKSLIVTILLSLLINSYITYNTISEGKTENSIRAYYASIYNKLIPKNESIIYCNDNFDYLLPGYVLRPRYLFIGSENTYLDTDRYSKLINKNKVKWLITKNYLGQIKKFKYYHIELRKELDSYESLSKRYLYAITKNSINAF